MSCEFGSRVRVTLFGQSHGEAVGAVLDGLPAGLPGLFFCWVPQTPSVKT